MFLSKIWFFLIAVAAAGALALALAMPRPAERETERSQTAQLHRACGITNILLTQNARDRVDLASAFARADAPPGRPRLKVDSILYNASKADRVTKDMHATAKLALSELIDNVKGNKPDFVIAIDRRGRVVARKGIQEATYGDSIKGYYSVDDALDGYLREDVWYVNKALYRVAVSPVVERRVGAYAGAIVLGHEFNKGLAERLSENTGAAVAFYVAGSATASSTSAQVHKEAAAAHKKLMESLEDTSAGGAQEDCSKGEPFVVKTSDASYNVLIARLPGEGRDAGAFFSVYSPRPAGVGFSGTLDKITSNDIAFGNFPWIPLGVAFLAMVGIGLALMIREADGPTRRLVKDAVALAKGESPRLDELKHKGKYGSIARSVNIILDKVDRETKTAKRDLDNILGPAPDGADAVPVPPVGPGGLASAPFSPPPPSEFKFGGGAADNVRPPTEDQSGPAAAPFDLDLPPPPPAVAETTPPNAATPAATPPPPVTLPPETLPVNRPATPPPPLPPTEASPAPQQATPPPRSATPPPPMRLDDDILGLDAPPPPRGGSDFDDPTVVADPSNSLLEQSAQSGSNGANDDEFRKVFDDFTALKKQCGESVASLTFDKFSGKLRKNRDALIAKHGCRSVKFQVYIKDGKAALKATPVKN